MPNIVSELIIELARVQRLLEAGKVDAREAQNLLRYGRDQMALNSYEGMRDALDDLSAFGKPKKPEPKT